MTLDDCVAVNSPFIEGHRQQLARSTLPTKPIQVIHGGSSENTPDLSEVLFVGSSVAPPSCVFFCPRVKTVTRPPGFLLRLPRRRPDPDRPTAKGRSFYTQTSAPSNEGGACLECGSKGRSRRGPKGSKGAVPPERGVVTGGGGVARRGGTPVKPPLSTAVGRRVRVSQTGTSSPRGEGGSNIGRETSDILDINIPAPNSTELALVAVGYSKLSGGDLSFLCWYRFKCIYLETPNAPKLLPPQQKAPLPVICPEKGHSA